MLRNGTSRTRGTVLLAVVLVILMSPPEVWTAPVKCKTLHKFTGGRDGALPIAGLIFDQAGNLYGTTAQGGTKGWGTVFKVTRAGVESVIHSFNPDGGDGGFPEASLISDLAGNLYGTTGNGGSNGGYGTVFKLTPQGDGSWKETVLYSFEFDGKDGVGPYAALVFDPAGNLYGTTVSGGSNAYGTVFKLTPQGDGRWKETVLHSFSRDLNDGTYPYAPLTLDSAGNLYGTTWSGGQNDDGIVFKLTPNPDGSWKETVIHYFSYYGDGAAPTGGLIFDSAGNLYGTARVGCGPGECDYALGTVFKLTPNSDGNWTLNVIHTFSGADGVFPSSSLTFDVAGNLYGTTLLGGTYNDGVVYKLKLEVNGNWRETVLHSFRNHPGNAPFAGLIIDEQGSLYGTTQGNSTMGTVGSVFKVSP
jgi:uncharacterized repeat protein (TIGR03803 family)